MKKRFNRGRSLKAFLVNGVTLGLLSLALSCCQTLKIPGNGPLSLSMPARPLGSTGYRVSLLSLGGSTLGRHGQETACEIINRALDMGVNYIDTAPRYCKGCNFLSETYIGRVMKDRRNEVFLATKSHDFSYSGTMELVKKSLKCLQTDRIDLYQHHGVSNDRQLRQVLSENGALKAFLELKEKKVVRFIGMTSHSPRILLKALELDVYDCMLISLNPAGRAMMDREYLDAFMNRAREKGVGVIVMNIADGGRLLRQGTTMQELFNYSLSYPVASALVGASMLWHVEENVQSVKNLSLIHI